MPSLLEDLKKIDEELWPYLISGGLSYCECSNSSPEPTTDQKKDWIVNNLIFAYSVTKEEITPVVEGNYEMIRRIGTHFGLGLKRELVNTILYALRLGETNETA